MRFLRKTPGIGLAVALFGSAAVAHADPPDACVSATVEGQKLQRAGKLVESRERFLTCARAECPEDIIARCERWAQGVTDAIPSLVVIPRDDAGKDVAAARVSIDGVRVGGRATEGPNGAATARAIELNPGAHRIVVERDGSATVTIDVVLHEAEKNRSVLASFPGPRATIAPHPVETERPVPVGVWVASGASAVAYGVFAVFAIDGAHERIASHCDTGCPGPEKTRVDSKLLAADLSLSIGTLALGVAAWLYFTRPVVARAPLRGMALAPDAATPFAFRW